MNRLIRNIDIRKSQYFLNKTWLLNVYLIKSDTNEIISDKTIVSLINHHLSLIEHSCISSEFIYLKTGFVFLHYGNRGVEIAFWHVGKWGATYEIYNCSWYCYGRDLEKMELLDSAEPVFCQYEILYLMKELSIFAEIIQNMDCEDMFRERYIELSKQLNIKCCY